MDRRWTNEGEQSREPSVVEDDDSAPEILVMYGDGRVAVLSYDESESE